MNNYPIHVIFHSISSILINFILLIGQMEYDWTTIRLENAKWNAARPWEWERERESRANFAVQTLLFDKGAS